ncbi:DEAD/DEAH box helicase [Bacillus thuringiensis]|uniref:DEAD/DEAH box helicase n=1 Tax=Bacillus thuringiensis TaxID=1428 RepID=UPI002D806D5D|nr:ATP-binding domain-containing protein [Bacillus thuringiensis]MEB4814942.1 ATP-binding domain-containing protein [Bacillus thuringiensis]
MINIIRGASSKPVSSERLIQYLISRNDIEGTLYLGYPIIGTVEGSLNIDALLISKQHGVIIFDIVEGSDLGDVYEKQDDAFTKLHSKFFQYSSLIKRRNLLVEIGVITYAPAYNGTFHNDDDYFVATNDTQLKTFLDAQEWQHSHLFNQLVAAIQAITTIKSRPKRAKVKKPDSKGAKIKKLEESIANLDSYQSQAVIETVEGVQRIRGLAGSGKTIILALKVAYLHTKHPDWKIAVTFNTRSLKNQFIELITRFTYEHKHAEPDWDKVKVIHAWGSPKADGIYYEVCKEHNVEYLDFQSAKAFNVPYGYEFDLVCQRAVNEISDYKELYDVILVDEAQDFSKYFLEICYNILGPQKRLIYAYDELQSLNKQTMLAPQEIFGTDDQGKPKVILKNEKNKPKQDIILKQCYRNSRPVLVTAHALGFGIYRDKGLVQMFDHNKLWKDIGYEIFEGNLADGNDVILGRTSEASPEFLEAHSSIDDLISFVKFDKNNDQIHWIADQIKKNLEDDELEYKDIMVINSDPLTTKSDVAPLRSLLFDMGINSHLAGVSTSPDDFFNDKSITFTSIYRAKGNEAAMVYVLNAQNSSEGSDLARKRNILFTAITRSKAWVRLCGYGPSMQHLLEEFKKIKSHEFTLDFKYPSVEERKTMNILNRDMTLEEKKTLRETKSNVDEVIRALQNKKIYKEDLSPEQLATLKELLGDD